MKQLLRPLLACRAFEKLRIPSHIQDFEYLKELPNLTHLDNRTESWRTVEDFWQAAK